MKQFLPILLLCLLGLTGCGDGGNSSTGTSNTSTASDTTPGETVEAFAYAMQAGDVEKLKSLCPDFEANLSVEEIQTLAKTLSSNARANGGIASITIDKETIDGDTATVTATLTNGNGLSGTETFDLNKRDGNWLIDMTRSFNKRQDETAIEAE